MSVYNFGVSGRTLTKLYQRTCREPAVIKWTLILQGVPPNTTTTTTTLIYIAPACPMTSEALADSSSRATECLTEKFGG